MQTFDQSLFHLYKSGLITLDEAIRRASNPDEFKLRIPGIQSTAGISRGGGESTLGGRDGGGAFSLDSSQCAGAGELPDLYLHPAPTLCTTLRCECSGGGRFRGPRLRS